jgi:hypothetical protein
MEKQRHTGRAAHPSERPNKSLLASKKRKARDEDTLNYRFESMPFDIHDDCDF